VDDPPLSGETGSSLFGRRFNIGSGKFLHGRRRRVRPDHGPFFGGTELGAVEETETSELGHGGGRRQFVELEM
jgi:hypothetical protein